MYLSANRFPTMWENGIRTSNFVFLFTHAIGKGNLRFHFCFPFSYYIENGIPTFIFVFSQLWTIELSVPIFVFRFYKILKKGIWTSIFFFCFCAFVTFLCYLNQKNIGTSWRYERLGNHMLDEVFVRCFLIEENSYEDLLEVIKNLYPILRGCTVVC